MYYEYSGHLRCDTVWVFPYVSEEHSPLSRVKECEKAEIYSVPEENTRNAICFVKELNFIFKYREYIYVYNRVKNMYIFM